MAAVVVVAETSSGTGSSSKDIVRVRLTCEKCPPGGLVDEGLVVLPLRPAASLWLSRLPIRPRRRFDSDIINGYASSLIPTFKTKIQNKIDQVTHNCIVLRCVAIIILDTYMSLVRYFFRKTSRVHLPMSAINQSAMTNYFAIYSIK